MAKNQHGSNFFSAVTPTLSVALIDDLGGRLAVLARCTGAPPTTANIFQHGCIIIRTDSGAGVNALYQNTGSSAVPVWTLLDTALGGGASSLVDTNNFGAVTVGTTAAAVNGLIVTDSATGAVGANAVTIASYGSDAAVSLTITPKGATGLLTLGLATGSGAITLGSSSVAQTVNIGNGAAFPTINIASTSIVGSLVTISGANTTSIGDTVQIATGNTTVAGGKVVNIATGTPSGAGTNIVTIGSNANTASTTTIKGGSGSTAIALTPQTTGAITLGAAAGTGDVVVGSSSATQTVKIGNGAGIQNVNIANVTVAGTTVNIAGAATGAGITDTINVSAGNAAATGIKVVNILTGIPGTSGNNRFTLGGGITSAATVNAVATNYKAWNRTTGSAVANAPVATLTDSSGNNITVAVGLRIILTLASTLQAGANTLNLNGHGADSIKSHLNVANDIAVAYAATGVVDLYFDGTRWLDMNQ